MFFLQHLSSKGSYFLRINQNLFHYERCSSNELSSMKINASLISSLRHYFFPFEIIFSLSSKKKQVSRVLTRALLGPVNVPFHIEFTKAFSQLIFLFLCLIIHFLFCSFQSSFYSQYFFWLIQCLFSPMFFIY